MSKRPSSTLHVQKIRLASNSLSESTLEFIQSVEPTEINQRSYYDRNKNH